MGPRAGLDGMAKRKKKDPFPSPAGNPTPVVQPIALSLNSPGFRIKIDVWETENLNENCDYPTEI
jgi:hypothetical protein